MAGAFFGLIHGLICSLPRVNDIAVGIAMMILGMGLAFYFGKPYVQPVAPDLPSINFGWWSDVPQVQAALRVNVLFLIGAALAFAMWWMFRATRVGLIIRVVGDSTDAARAMGLRPALIRTLQRRPAAPLPGLAAHICPCSIRAAGTRASPRAKA